jgi:hypothetical protein
MPIESTSLNGLDPSAPFEPLLNTPSQSKIYALIRSSFSPSTYESVTNVPPNALFIKSEFISLIVSRGCTVKENDMDNNNKWHKVPERTIIPFVE